MIALDTSAVFAILADEPERRRFNGVIAAAGAAVMSAATLVELRIVLFARSGQMALNSLDAFLHRSNTRIEPVDMPMADAAFAAFRRFGKGTGHPAGLNFGDCFSYALAMHLQLPLLFKGEDFSRTDLIDAAARVCQGKVGTGFPEKTNENKETWSLSDSE